MKLPYNSSTIFNMFQQFIENNSTGSEEFDMRNSRDFSFLTNLWDCNNRKITLTQAELSKFCNGSFTLAKFVSQTINNSNSHWYETVLVLATLGDVTKNRNNPICVMSPKVANASTISCRCRCHCCHCYRVTFANVNMA